MRVLIFGCLIFLIGVWNRNITNNSSHKQNSNTVLKHCPVNQIFRVLVKKERVGAIACISNDAYFMFPMIVDIYPHKDQW